VTDESNTFIDLLRERVGAGNVRTEAHLLDDESHDEALGAEPATPRAVVLPEHTGHVSEVLTTCADHGVPVTARGSGSGLSGACIPPDDGVVVSFQRMNKILEIDQDTHLAVVQPGVQLDQLDAELANLKLAYPVYPGEYSSTIGGNIATNAGGMQAVKHGVTRHHVLGLELALATGEVIRTGGRVVKASSGYDLTQLVIGSEGTLALVTEATLQLVPRPAFSATVLAPFPTLDEVAAAVPHVIASGLGPTILEYIDILTMAAMQREYSLELGVPEDVRATALAYLVVRMDSDHDDRLDADVQAVAELLVKLGAMDVYVLPAQAAARLIEAREKAFWLAKGNGADDIVDIAVPRRTIPDFMKRAREIGDAHGALISGCGHAGDGNIHLAVFQKDAGERKQLMLELFAAGIDLGGVISGEHGIGITKKPYFLALEDPTKVALMRRIKQAFDPAGILNPGKIFDVDGAS
jgi:glycolate oxidase